MSWTAPRTWVTGELVTAALMNTHVRDNLSYLHDEHTKFVWKSSDETVNNSAALQNDDALLFAIGASETWIFKFNLLFESSATADFKFAITTPTASTVKYWTGVFETTGGPVGMGYPINAASGTAVAIAGNGAGVGYAFRIYGFVINSTNAGNVTLQWAQNGAEVSDTKVLAGSHLVANRIS